jgi:hypothetical protein
LYGVFEIHQMFLLNQVIQFWFLNLRTSNIIMKNDYSLNAPAWCNS